MFTELFPIVATPDLQRALSFYRDALGGVISFEFPGPDGRPAYVGIDLGSSHVGIGQVEGLDGGARRPISLWIYADDCDAAFARLRDGDAPVVEPPTDQPWGERVARVQDPDGNDIFIGQRQAAPGPRDGVGASLLSPEPERYTRPEYERRFLVSPGSDWRDRVESYSKVFDDRYIRHTHLRVRTLSDSSIGQEFIKLTKKLRSDSPYVQLTGSIPLSPMEYEFLAALPADTIRKVRHYHFHEGNVFSIDVFDGPLAGLVLCEVEMGSIEALMEVAVPDYSLMEVTEDLFFTGGNLSRTTREALRQKLASVGVEL